MSTHEQESEVKRPPLRRQGAVADLRPLMASRDLAAASSASSSAGSPAPRQAAEPEAMPSG